MFLNFDYCIILFTLYSSGVFASLNRTVISLSPNPITSPSRTRPTVSRKFQQLDYLGFRYASGDFLNNLTTLERVK